MASQRRIRRWAGRCFAQPEKYRLYQVQHRIAGNVISPGRVAAKTEGENMIPRIHEEGCQGTSLTSARIEYRDLEAASHKRLGMQRKVNEEWRRYEAGYRSEDTNPREFQPNA